MEGSVKERQEAKKQFDTAVKQGHGAYLLEVRVLGCSLRRATRLLLSGLHTFPCLASRRTWTALTFSKPASATFQQARSWSWCCRT